MFSQTETLINNKYYGILLVKEEVSNMADTYIDEKFVMCPKFQRTFSILGKKWNGLIIDVLLAEGPQRFVELASKIPHVSDRVLVERLKELEQNGIVSRNVSDIADKQRIKYELTTKGIDLEKVIKEVHTWSEKWSVSE